MTNQSPSAPGAAPAAAGSSLSQTQQHHSHDDDNSILSSPHSVDSSPDHDPDSRSHSLSHAHSHLHSHSHSHSHSQSTHSHLHSSSSSRHHDASGDDNRGDSHNHQDEPNSDVSDQSLELRQAGADDQPAQDDPWETRVVQTIELIQVVDHSGNPVSTSTNYVEPNTVVVDRVSGKTAAISAPGSSRTAPASSPEAGHHGSSPPSSRTYRPPVTYSTTTHSVSQSPTSQPTASPTYSPSGSVTSPVSSPPPISSGVLHNNSMEYTPCRRGQSTNRQF